MKRVFLILTILLLRAIVVSADPISREQAQQNALLFLKQQGDQRKLTPVADGLRLSRQRRASFVSVLSEHFRERFKSDTELFYVLILIVRFKPEYGYAVLREQRFKAFKLKILLYLTFQHMIHDALDIALLNEPRSISVHRIVPDK